MIYVAVDSLLWTMDCTPHTPLISLLLQHFLGEAAMCSVVECEGSFGPENTAELGTPHEINPDSSVLWHPERKLFCFDSLFFSFLNDNSCLQARTCTGWTWVMGNKTPCHIKPIQNLLQTVILEKHYRVSVLLSSVINSIICCFSFSVLNKGQRQMQCD